MKPETLRTLKIYGRGIATGVSLTTAVAFGPDAVRAYNSLVETKVQRSAFADGRKNLSAVSTQDLSYRNEKIEERKGEAFNKGGDVPNENDARGKLDHAESRFELSGAPQEIVDPGLDNVRSLILKGDRDYKEAKDAIITLDDALDPYHDILQNKQDKEEVRAAFAAAKGAGSTMVWAGLETGVFIRRKRKESYSSPAINKAPIRTTSTEVVRYR